MTVIPLWVARWRPSGFRPLGFVLVLELFPRLLAIERPVDLDAFSIYASVPGASFCSQNPNAADPALAQALFGKQANLELGLVQPTPMYRRVVNGEPIPQRPTLLLAETLHQRFPRV